MGRFLSYIINRLARVFWVRNQNSNWLERSTTGYLIFNPAWPDPPRQWYPTLDAALVDANKLVRKQPQDSFYILKAVQLVQTGPFIVKELAGGDK